MQLNIDILLEFIQNRVQDFEKDLYDSISQIKRTNDIDKISIIVGKILIIKKFLDNIYLSFNDDLKVVLDQRIGKKEKIFRILKDFDRIDDVETRKILVEKIKEGFYD